MPTINNVPTTQYIGPKIVPHFANPAEWSINNEYDALSIVTNNGNTYWAKYNVPSGIDISNTEYWYLSAYPDAQIQAYRNEVMEYARTVDGFADAIAQNSSDITELKSAVSGNKISAGITPWYLGNFWSMYHPQGCCRDSNSAYFINTADNLGTYVYIANLGTNSISSIKVDAEIYGHGNSMCYDKNRSRFWICGSNLYYKGSTDTFRNPIQFTNGVPARGFSCISFDDVTETLWAFSGLTDDITNDIYRMGKNANTFTYYGQYDNSAQHRQDIAVEDNILYVADTKGNITICDLNSLDENNRVTKIDSCTIEKHDTALKYMFGEPEGIEFYNGVMYASAACIGQSDSYNTVFLGIPFGGNSIRNEVAIFEPLDVTLNATTNAKFAKDTNEIGNLADLRFLFNKSFRAVNINGNFTDEFSFAIPDGITLTFSANENETANVTLGGGLLFGSAAFRIDGRVTITAASTERVFRALNSGGIITINMAGTFSGNKFIDSGTLKPLYVLTGTDGHNIPIEGVTVSTYPAMLVNGSLVELTYA